MAQAPYKIILLMDVKKKRQISIFLNKEKKVPDFSKSILEQLLMAKTMQS